MSRRFAYRAALAPLRRVDSVPLLRPPPASLAPARSASKRTRHRSAHVRTPPPHARACAWLQVESIQIDKGSLTYLGQVAERTSLRHAVQLLTPAAMMARTNGRDGIVPRDLEDVDGLFHDAKQSAKLLAEQADKFVS